MTGSVQQADTFHLIGHTLVNHFAVDSVAVDGRVSVVYRGRHVGPAQPVAIEVFKLPTNVDAAQMTAFAKRFREEHKEHAKLAKEDIRFVRTVGSGTAPLTETTRLFFMVTEWLDGKPLELDGDRRRTATEVFTLLDTGVRALATAHERGLTHGAIQPEVFFFLEDGTLKVLDLGMHDLIGRLWNDVVPGMPMPRMVALEYAAPEHFDPKLGAYGKEADVYALARVAVACLHGRAPWAGQTEAVVAKLALDPARRPTPRVFGMQIGDATEAVFGRALALDPKRRFPDVGAFWTALDEAIKTDATTPKKAVTAEKRAEAKKVEPKPKEEKPKEEKRALELKPIEVKLPELKPAKTLDVKSLEAKGVSKNVEVKSVDAKPAEAKPAEAKRSDAKPADAKRSEAKPAEAKRSDAKPAEPKAGTKIKEPTSEVLKVASPKASLRAEELDEGWGGQSMPPNPASGPEETAKVPVVDLARVASALDPAPAPKPPVPTVHAMPPPARPAPAPAPPPAPPLHIETYDEVPVSLESEPPALQAGAAPALDAEQPRQPSVVPIAKPLETISPGTLFAEKYRIEKVVGTGGTGIVMVAMHTFLERRVAIKILTAGDSLQAYSDLPNAPPADAERLRRFRREATIAARIESPHVVSVLDFGVHAQSGAPYIVMEYLEGTDLAQVLKTRPQLPMDELLDYFVQACAGVAKAHHVGIVHRDLKPQNLYLSRNKEGAQVVKVLDFGVSKLTADSSLFASEIASTLVANLIGSPRYMAPEQLQSVHDVDHRVDIYSLGATLYELIAGKPIFPGESLYEIFKQILWDSPTPLSAHRPAIPAELEIVVMRCLKKRPEERYGSVGELLDALAPYAPTRVQPLIAQTRRLGIGRKNFASTDEAAMAATEAANLAPESPANASAGNSAEPSNALQPLVAKSDGAQPPQTQQAPRPTPSMMPFGVRVPPRAMVAGLVAVAFILALLIWWGLH